MDHHLTVTKVPQRLYNYFGDPECFPLVPSPKFKSSEISQHLQHGLEEEFNRHHCASDSSTSAITRLTFVVQKFTWMMNCSHIGDPLMFLSHAVIRSKSVHDQIFAKLPSSPINNNMYVIIINVVLNTK